MLNILHSYELIAIFVVVVVGSDDGVACLDTNFSCLFLVINRFDAISFDTLRVCVYALFFKIHVHFMYNR